ncbi:MAG: ROK family transcriptional regulator [Rhodobacteraceae bacterium]|nr:ROK family transcriptional regulator [Paracoccaceae bacterium]
MIESDPYDPLAENGCGPSRRAAEGPRSLKQQLFEAVRASGKVPRVELARSLGISPASVSSICASLISSGLIEERSDVSKSADTGRGRPRVALSVRGKARYVAGVKLSDHVHSAIILDLSGAMIANASFKRSGGIQTHDALLSEAREVLDRALSSAGLERSNLSSVGLGVPGLIDNKAGKVLWSPLLVDRDVKLRERFSDLVGIPVEIDNDANLVALAELWFGAGRERGEFVVVTIEHGVGMGLVLDHGLFRGAMGMGMELGHTIVQLDGALCRCGKRGCLEAYVSDYALIREARTALNLGNRRVKSPQILLESLFDHAKAGNEAARAIFGRAGRYLALGLANVANLFDPSLILLSGDRMRYDYLYAEEVLSEMMELMIKTGRPAPQVEIRTWGDLLWARGAGALALDAATRDAFSCEPAVA